jgi:CRP-like cAMP-binding protein
MTEVDVLVVPVAVLDDIVRAHPVVAREMVRESDNRVRQAAVALQSVGRQLPRGRAVVG